MLKIKLFTVATELIENNKRAIREDTGKFKEQS